ncbi:MAG: Gfo/Idh/MocA family oxidoreductase [Verrucomicrobiota bacterium]
MNNWNRRQFLKSAVTTTGSILAAPTIIPASALGRDGAVAPNERLVMGVIGLGGRGQYDLGIFMDNKDVQVVAVSDVFGDRRAAGKVQVDRKYSNKDCATYRDLRELLARPDIDAVLIATGDNWHSLASILAARAGKDIYSEKPMSVAITESRAVVETVRRFARVYQCGTQRRSIFRFRFAMDLARSGKLGQLKTLYAEKAPMGEEYHERTLPPEPQPDRDVFDWDLWLGPAAWRPYNKQYPTRGFWSAHLDFSGGAINEWGSHTADLCQFANDADATGPIEYEPWEGTVVAHYANGVKLIFEKGVWPLHVKFEGTKGWAYVDDDGNLETNPASLKAVRDFGKGYPAEDHVRNFLDCVKTRQQPISHAEVAHRSVSVCHIANISRRLGRPVKWDPAKEEFIGDEQANRMRSRAQREPWQI